MQVYCILSSECHPWFINQEWYNVFLPFVILANTGNPLEAIIETAKTEDLIATPDIPKWQTDWTSKYLSAPNVDKIAVKNLENELIALAAYQIRGHCAYVYILYAESAPHSNPTMNSKSMRKYYGIGELLIAYGIKYSIDHGCRVDIVF